MKGKITPFVYDSNINEDNQSLGDGTGLKYGVSVTDACIDWEDTVSALTKLSDAVEARRKLVTVES